MKTYMGGVIEALVWVQSLLDENIEDPKGIQKVRREVHATLKDVTNGLAGDFREKIRICARS